jgi:REP element-mobilizing transposase RayT
MPIVNGEYRRPQLRNGKINYRFGWFFVTFQVFENKSELGAIVGECCVLNALGEAVKNLIETLPKFNHEVFVDAFVVMPNHVHLILKIEDRLTNTEHHLGKIIGKLKSLAAREYRLLKEKGLVRDIGSKLWQTNYWEKIITSHEQLEAIRTYIVNNPKKWSIDRFGPVTTHSLGNLDLLNEPFVAFVASQEGRQGVTALRLENREVQGMTALRTESALGVRGCHAPQKMPVISTFTSSQERAILRKLISQGRRFIAVYPGGIPKVLPDEIKNLVDSGNALLLSPVESGTGVNKQRAIWCNEYLIRRAQKVWCGYIKPGGTLESILKGIGGSRYE